MQFVKYSHQVENIAPDFDDQFRRNLEKGQERIRASATKGTAERDAFVASHALVRAEVEILDDLAAEYAQGIYAQPGRHGALLRFSNFLPGFHAKGMGVK